MRRRTMIVVSLLATLAALPQTASARPRHLPGLFGVITAPIGAIFGGVRRMAHHPGRHRHTVASRRTRARAATTAAAAGTAAGAVALAPSNPASSQSGAAATTATGTTPSAEPTVAAATPPTAPLPLAAATEEPAPAITASVPAQRNAALASTSEELQPAAAETRPARRPAASSYLGHVGPLTWPSAYEDIVGYTLWPQQYGERLRVHGMADVLGSAFVAPATLAAKAQASNAQARLNVQAKLGDAEETAAAPGACAGAPASIEWPADEIARSISLTDAQRGSLDDLKRTLGDAVATIASTCRDTTNLNPVERLQAMQATLWAVHDAALLIRAPLAAFYDSLADDQKRQFAAPTEAAATHAMSRGELARLCGMPSSLDSSMHHIERSLHVTKAQRASLDALNKKSFEMGQFLMASCLKPVAATPAGRLDGAADRLTALLFAASTLGPAVNNFYAQLSDEQKTKLKSLR